MDFLQPKTKCQLSLVIATIAVSGASIFIRFCSSPAVVIAFWRLFLSVAFLIPLLLDNNIKTRINLFLRWNYLRIFILSGFFLSLHFLSWIQSLKFTTVASSVIVVNSSPIWVILFSFILFREKITKFQVIGLVIGLIGLLLIASPQNLLQIETSFHEGVFLALLGAFMVALYFIIGKRMRAEYTVPNVIYIFFVNSFCFIFLFIYSMILGNYVWIFPVEDFIWFITLAIGPSLLGHALYTYAMKHLSAQTVSLTVIGEAVGASILGWIILSEKLPPTTLLGGVLVFIGIYLNVKFDITNKN